MLLGLSKEIEEYKLKYNTSYIDAVLTISQKYDIEIEELPKILHQNILEKLKQEFRELNLVNEQKEKNLLSLLEEEK